MRIVVMLLALRRGASLNQAAAAARLKRVPPGWQVAAPSADDAAVVEERQLGHPANMVGVPAVSLCRHGYPQAVLPCVQSNFGRLTPSTRCCLRNCVCSMAWRLHAIEAPRHRREQT